MTAEVEPTPTELRAQARAGRKSFASSVDSQFVKAMKRVMSDYLEARAQGVSRADAVKGIEEVLRAEWPQRPTKFPTCEGCGGAAWRVTYCTHNRRCGRERCSMAEPEYEHSYVVYCDCEAGVTLRGKHDRKGIEDDLARIGRTKKRARGFSRLGA
jgi:hypothetical protein